MPSRTVPQAGVRLEPINDGDASASIGIFGEIGWDVTAEDVAAAVAQAKGKPLNVDIFSYGGDALQGLAIYQILSAHDAEVTTNVLGIAASAATPIFLAGNKRKVAVNAALMVHNPWGVTIGDADEHRRQAATLDGVQAAYLYTYSNATGIPAADIQSYLTEERWMYGEEAVALGFATEAPEPIKAFASIAPPPADRFRQIPDDLKAMAGISVEAPAEIVDPADSPEDPKPKVTAADPTAALESVARAMNPAPLTMTSLSTEQPTPQTAALPMTVQTPDLEAIRLEERDRVKAIRGMAQIHNLPGDLVDHLINNGVAVADAREQVLAKIATRHEATVGAVADAGYGSVGMGQAEVKQYSVMNVLRYLADPKPATASAAGYELEWSEEAQKQHSRSAAGVIIPHDVIASRPRAAAAGTLAAGGALVGTDRLDGSFVELVRQRSAFISAGATVLSGLQGNVEIGRQTGKSTYYFVGEDVDVTTSDLTFGLINMTPKTIGARVPVSRRLMIQSSPDIETLVRNDIINEITLGVDYVTGYGTGSSSQPLGLANNNGIGGVTMSAGTTINFSTQQGGGSGLVGVWGDYVNLETAISNANLDIGAMRYVMNSAMRGGCKQVLRASAAGSDYIMTDAGTINGYPVSVSNQIQQNDVFFGNFSELLVGFWSGIDLVVDPYTQSAKGQVIFTAFQDFDVAARRANSFARGT
jgi:HK97 family phage major capsid protein